MVELFLQSPETNDTVDTPGESLFPGCVLSPDLSDGKETAERALKGSTDSRIELGCETAGGTAPKLEADQSRPQFTDRYELSESSSLHHKFLVEVYFDGTRPKAKVDRLPKDPEEKEAHIFDLRDRGADMINYIEDDMKRSPSHSGGTLTHEGPRLERGKVDNVIFATETMNLEGCVVKRNAECTVRLPVKLSQAHAVSLQQISYAVTLYVHRIGKHTREVVAEDTGVYRGSAAIPVSIKPGVLEEGMCKLEAIIHLFTAGPDMPHEMQFWESKVLTVRS